MNTYITVNLPVVLLIAFSIVMFLVATVIKVKMKLKSERGDFGMGVMIISLLYVCVWIVPSLVAWGGWASYLAWSK